MWGPPRAAWFLVDGSVSTVQAGVQEADVGVGLQKRTCGTQVHAWLGLHLISPVRLHADTGSHGLRQAGRPPTGDPGGSGWAADMCGVQGRT